MTLNVIDNRGDSNISTTTAIIFDTGPEADFTATPTSGQEPLTVSFTDTSSTNDGINAWEWDFDDDGEIDNVTENPVYEYAQNGTYNVTLTVYEADGDSNTITKIDYITVTTEATEPPTLHIESINVYFTETKRAGPNIFGYATAVVTIVNETGNPIQNATVSGNWSGATYDSDSDITDNFGNVSLYSDTAKVRSGDKFTLTVTDVYLAGWTYNASANIETYDSIDV